VRVNISRILFILLLLAVMAAAQTQPPPPPQTQPNEPEHHITKAEADELFRDVDEILKFDSQQTGLPLKHPVKRKLTSRAEVEKFFLDSFKEDKQAKRLQQSEFVLKRFGLIPRDFNLEGYMLAMLREQVAGYYDPKTKTVNILDWLDPEAQKPVLVHELVHALQDQNYGLRDFFDEKKLKPKGKYDVLSDEQLAARQAIVEGQATAVMIDSMLAPSGKSAATAPTMVKAVEAGMLEGTGSPIYKKAPRYIRDSLIFPYTTGLDFTVSLLQISKAKAYAEAFQNAPVDTRQIMEPEVYLAGEKVPAIPMPDFDRVLGHDWQQFDVGGVGEFDISVMAREYGADEDNAKALTSAWRQGYYFAATKKGLKVTGPGDVSLIYVSRWATPELAEKFATLYGESLGRRHRNVTSGSLTQRHWSTDDGEVYMRREGDLVMVTENFDRANSGMLIDATIKAVGGTTSQ
jgi:hypothetical protein